MIKFKPFICFVLVLFLEFAASTDSTLPEVSHKVFFEISIGGAPAGLIVMGLYGNQDQVPKTAAKFRALCIGGNRTNSQGQPHEYKGTEFTYIIEGQSLEGGRDMSDMGMSIYDVSFPAERPKNASTYYSKYVLAMTTPIPMESEELYTSEVIMNSAFSISLGNEYLDS
eukprot:351447_1